MTNAQEIELDILSAYMGNPLTDEQKEFASDFTKDTISFSDPGTGKTHTLIAGLILAQTFYHIRGDSINCMSFTNAAVSEIAGRYQALCKKKKVSPTVMFNTFHSLSNKIMHDAYPRMTIIRGSRKSDIEDMARYLKEEGVDVNVDTDYQYIRRVVNSVNKLNSALIFHPDNIESRYDFLQLNLTVDVFQRLRTSWFLRGITDNQITQGDIPLYCLYALMRKPDIVRKWKGKYKIMVVDEFQDLSLLHLRILSYIAETLIVIGDMKQQIYAFNGACPQIVKEYLKLHPNARVCNLTQSFRCGQEIAEFATNVIKPNDPSVQCFKGHDRGSSVSIVHRNNLDWKSIAANLENAQKLHGSGEAHNTMFLYRNNASMIPIIEELYKRNIPFRCGNFQTIMETPYFVSLTKLVNMAWNPTDPDTVAAALRLFPEFKSLPYTEEPGPACVVRSTGKSILEIAYHYKNKSSKDIIDCCKVAREAIVANKFASVVYNKVMPAYKAYIMDGEKWKWDNDIDFYINLVAEICNTKTYPIMCNEEIDKAQRNVINMRANAGIRCYTLHTAKGLEADDVYILDCDEGIFPNKKEMKKKLRINCDLDVATDIRAERNLLYVAITRAKNNVIISYSGDKPTRLITNPNDEEYAKYDEVYKEYNVDYDDATEFFKLFKLGE